MNAKDDVEIIGQTTAYRGYFRIDRYRLRHRTFDGGWTGEMERELFERGHAVAVLLYDPLRDEVALVEQFRVGALAAGWQPWMIEIVAGIIDDGESEEQVARRECREECGCEVGELVPVARYLASPGGTSESVQLYCGRCDTSRLGGLHGLAEEHEDIRVLVVPAAEAIAMAADGRIANGASLIAVLWFEIHRPELRRRWLGA